MCSLACGSASARHREYKQPYKGGSHSLVAGGRSPPSRCQALPGLRESPSSPRVVNDVLWSVVVFRPIGAIAGIVAVPLCSCARSADRRSTEPPVNALFEDYLAAIRTRVHEPFVGGFLEETASSSVPALFDPWVATCVIDQTPSFLGFRSMRPLVRIQPPRPRTNEGAVAPCFLPAALDGRARR